jgi:predicted amidohydrolase YtcJ
LAILISLRPPAARAAPRLTQIAAPDGGVDLLMVDGHIRTPDGWVEAMAVRHGIILAVGDTAAMTALKGAATRVIDLRGRTVLPGLHDVHVHPIFAGTREQRCRIAQGSTLEETLRRVKECVAKAGPGKWVTGGQWDVSALGRIPDRKLLDAVAPNNPVLLEDTSAHSVWGNSKALALAGVGKNTPDPKGGIIERDGRGQPTGILRESAMDDAAKHVPPPSAAEVQSALAWGLERMLSYGITSFTEAAVGFSSDPQTELEAYAALADRGVLKQRARVCMVWSPSDGQADMIIATRNFYARDRLRPDCVKIFLDGVPTDSHTAAMLEDYQGGVAGRSDEASRRGLLQVKQDVLDEAVTRFDRMGLTVKFHAAGDAAVREGLNAIEAARRANGFSPSMHNVGHCTFVAEADIPRARGIEATFEVSPYLWGPTPINDSITSAVGPALIKRVWPVREMLEAGALVVPGSDWSVVPSVDPWIGIETLVTRERPGGSADSFGKDEAISLPQALELFTVNSAKQEGVADLVGRIAPGMLADVIVVDRDPYAIPATQLHSVKVEMTFIAGEKAYDAAAAPGDERGTAAQN